LLQRSSLGKTLSMIIWGNLCFNFRWNNHWSNLIYHPIKFWITRTNSRANRKIKTKRKTIMNLYDEGKFPIFMRWHQMSLIHTFNKGVQSRRRVFLFKEIFKQTTTINCCYLWTFLFPFMCGNWQLTLIDYSVSLLDQGNEISMGGHPPT